MIEHTQAATESIALQARQLEAIRAYESDTFSAQAEELTPVEAQQMLNLLQRRLLDVIAEGGTLMVDGVVLAGLLDEVRENR